MATIYHLGIKKGSTTWTVPIYDNTAEAGSAYSYIKYGGKSGYIPLCSTSDSRATGGRVKKHTGSEFAISISGAPPYTKKTYSNPGTYSFTVPAGVTKLRYEVAGAGGGGAGYHSWSALSGEHMKQFGAKGGSGGAGAKNKGTFSVAPGNTIAITVGSGGAGGSPDNNGSSGGSSSVNGIGAGAGGGGKISSTSNTTGASGSNSGNGSGGAGGAGGASRNASGSSGNNGWVIIEYGMGVQ